MNPDNVEIEVTLSVRGGQYNGTVYGSVTRKVRGEIDPEVASTTLRGVVSEAQADCIAAIDQSLAFKQAEKGNI